MAFRGFGKIRKCGGRLGQEADNKFGVRIKPTRGGQVSAKNQVEASVKPRRVDDLGYNRDKGTRVKVRVDQRLGLGWRYQGYSQGIAAATEWGLHSSRTPATMLAHSWLNPLPSGQSRMNGGPTSLQCG